LKAKLREFIRIHPSRALQWLGCALFLIAGGRASAQTQSLTWQQVRDRFEQSNPTLQADEFNVSESKAEEITQYLRPNPQLTLSTDGTQLAPHNGKYVPFLGSQFVANGSYLHEREHKRELRLLAQQDATAVAASTHSDLERNLIFNLRSTFVAVLQAKAILRLANADLAYWDQVLDISRIQFKAGGMAQIDLDRLELQRVQFESEVQTAEVNLRTAKIELLMLLDDRTPVEQFDVDGPFDYTEQIRPLDTFRQVALDNRPDLRAAMQSIDEAKANYQLAVSNGSTDPTFSGWYSLNPSFNNPNDRDTVGFSVSIPLRIFDRNQGEKLRTKLDIDRNERLTAAAKAQVFNDVDSAYAEWNSTLILLRPYKAKYLDLAVHVRDTVRFSYEHGGASLLDFLSAESDYRQIQLNYLTLIGTYLTYAAQVNMAVGKDVIQ
jgi:cobalt-zinc-cadmium efflux system outer membrane protein